MTTTTVPGPWRAIAGTARGAAHVARGLDNQDSVESQFIDTVGGTVVAVADGHGHDRHFRSAAGSRLATRSACAVMTKLAGEIAGEPWTAGLAGAMCGKLPQDIVDEWRAGVASDIAAHPYAADELAALERAGDGPEVPYGSTLLVALVAEGWLVCAQIGDGDLVGIRPDGQAWSPVAGDDLLDGHRTTSLCQSGAAASFRTAAHDLRSQPLLALLLGSDGYGNAQASDPWQPTAAEDIAELATGHDDDWFAQQLPAWAQRCASAGGSGDDTTVALLLAPDSRQRAAAARLAVRQDEATVPAAPTIPITMAAPVTTPVPPPPPPAPPGPWRHAAPQSRRGRRRLALAGIGAVVAAGAIIVGVALSQSPGQGPAAKPTARPVPRATQTAAPTATATAGFSRHSPSGTARQAPPVRHRPSGTVRQAQPG